MGGLEAAGRRTPLLERDDARAKLSRALDESLAGDNLVEWSLLDLSVD
jgi:hypothetical protein